MTHRSLIVDLFQGQLRSTLKCLKCKQVSIKFDCFMYLSVPIPHKRLNDFPPTLEECIEAFTREEILEGENAWNCPNCRT